MWAPKGVRPIASNNTKYKWIYVYGFVHPATGKPFWLLMPTVNTVVMNIALAEFAKFANPDGKKLVVLLIDGAGWHTSKDLVIPDGILLHPLPPYTPELQPVESAWPLIKEPAVNRSFKTLDELEQVLIERCKYLSANTEILKGQVGFGWVARHG
jgi:transposase